MPAKNVIIIANSVYPDQGYGSAHAHKLIMNCKVLLHCNPLCLVLPLFFFATVYPNQGSRSAVFDLTNMYKNLYFKVLLHRKPLCLVLPLYTSTDTSRA